jgi:hypothetical protein
VVRIPTCVIWQQLKRSSSNPETDPRIRAFFSNVFSGFRCQQFFLFHCTHNRIERAKLFGQRTSSRNYLGVSARAFGLSTLLTKVVVVLPPALPSLVQKKKESPPDFEALPINQSINNNHDSPANQSHAIHSHIFSPLHLRSLTTSKQQARPRKSYRLGRRAGLRASKFH